MTIPVIKVKVSPKASLKGKMDVRFPGKVTVVAPLLLDTTGGNFAFSLDATGLAQNAANIVLAGLAPSATTDTTNASNITSGTLPAARLPTPTPTTLGGVKSLAAVSNKVLTSIGTDGLPVASDVMFTPVGTGAVTRTMQDKVRESVSVKDFGAACDGSTDDTTAIQTAINFCLSGARPVPLRVPGLCKVTSPLIIDRAVGSNAGADTFTIIGEGAFAGFTTSAAITIIDSFLPYIGGTFAPSCNIRFERITFLGTGTTTTFCVSDKFLKVHFEACRFNLIRCVLATFYLQSWRWHNCSMAGWAGLFAANTATYYDCHWSDCDFESGGDGIKSFNGGFDGSSITNCLFENSGRFFSQAIGLGTTIIGNYTEGNSAPDYQLSDVGAGGYHRGTIFSGNFMAGNLHSLYNVIVGDCQGMIAGGNYTDAKLYDVTGTTAGSFKSIGDYAVTSKFSAAGSFDLNHAGDYIEGVLASGSATTLITGNAKTITSIFLQPGDWDVSGVVGYIPAATTSVTRYSSSVSLTNNAVGAEGNANVNTFAAFVSGGFTVNYPTPVVRVSVSVATTVYLVAFADFTASTMTAFGRIRARKAGGQ